MPTKFAGTKSALYLQAASGGASLVALCGRQLTLQREREVVEITTTVGDQVGHVVGIKRGTVSFNNLSLFLAASDSGFSDVQVKTWWGAGTKLYGQIIDDPNGGEFRVIEEFYCFISNYTINRNNNEVATFDCELVITAIDSPAPPSDVCPVVTVTRYPRRLVLTFAGTDGLYYTFEILPYASDTITGAPWEAEFTGLVPGTAYTIILSVFDYATGVTVECASIVTSTTAIFTYDGFGGETLEEACGESNAQIAYSELPLGVGVILYEDAALTIPYNNYSRIKINGIVYAVNGSGEITSIIGPCEGPMVYGYRVASGGNPCGRQVLKYSNSGTFGSGMTLYWNTALTLVFVSDALCAGFTADDVPSGVLVGVVPSDGEIFDFINGVVGNSTGSVC